MDLVYGILGAILVSFILTVLRSLISLGKSKEKRSSNFFQKFTGTLMVLIVIILIGYVLEISGCSTEEEPNYPMKYSPD
jgi:uncharacterized membrane protein